MKSVIDLLSDNDILSQIIKRERPGNYELLHKDYDLKITPTTQGLSQYPCIKLTFGDLDVLSFDKRRYIELFLFSDYLFFKISATETQDSRRLSFEKSRRKNDPSLIIGSFGVKITCDYDKYKELCEFKGKYHVHKKQSGTTEYYYVCRSEKIQ